MCLPIELREQECSKVMCKTFLTKRTLEIPFVAVEECLGDAPPLRHSTRMSEEYLRTALLFGKTYNTHCRQDMRSF